MNDKQMKGRQYIRNVAMVMIFLIVTLPLHSSVVMGAVINSVNGFGQHGVPGFRARTDVTIVNVSATVPEDSDLGSGQVKILEDPTRPFECSLVDEVMQTFNCLMEYPETTLPSALATLPFTVQIFDDAGGPLSPPRQGSVMVDSLPPKLLGVDYTALATGAVEADFRVRDEACDQPECTGRCAGLASIRFTSGGAAVGEVSDFEDGICEQTGRVNLTGLIVGGDVGEKRVCIEMADVFGQGATECEDVMIDAKPPEITGLRMEDSDGKPIRFTNGEPIHPVYLKINITEHSGFFLPGQDGQVNKLKVDASQFSERPDHQEAFSNLIAGCKNGTGENNYVCSVGNLFLIATSPRNIQVRVEAEDEHENVLNETKSISVTFDNTPPVATKIYSNYFNDKSQYLLREDKNNTIMMDITESGAGMGNRYVFLDFSTFSEYANTAPNMCEKSGETWTCKWKYIPVKGRSTGDRIALQPGVGSKDDAFNPMQSTTDTLFVDIDPPEAMEDISNITGVGEGHDRSTDLVGGDMIEVHLFVKDHYGVKEAVANLSEMVEGGEESAVGECTENQAFPDEAQRIYECVWEAGPIMPGYLGPEAGNAPSIYFKFKDYANHTGEHEWDGIEILASENVTRPTWKAEAVSYSPEMGIDRLSWKLQEPKMYYQVKFEAVSGRDPELLSIEIDKQTCTGLEYVNVNPLTNDVAIELLGFPVYESRPEPPFRDVVEISFNPESVPELETVDENNRTVPFEGFYVKCPVIITSIVRTGVAGEEKALTLPERVNLSFYVPVYNNPLGQNIGNIKDKIKEMQDSNDNYKWLTILRQIFDYASAICDLIKTLIEVDAAIAAVKDIFANTCGTTTAVGDPANSCTISGSLGQVMESDDTLIPEIIKEVHQFCGLFISCRVTQQPRATCSSATGSERSWCNVQETWGRITGWYARSINSITVDWMQARGTNFFNTASFDPKKSMFSSAMSLCIPGLITNFEKLRQIHCKKILCYKIDVAQGRPVWRCDQEYSYLICTHLVGQAFAAIPLFQFVSDVGGMIEGIFRNPYGLIGLVIDKACAIICSGERSTGCAVCRGITFLPAAANIIVDLVESTGPRFKMAKFDMCEEALKEEPDYNNVKPPVPAAGTAAAGD